ncbi:MAG: hypothetical protein Q4C95_12035 [Planctomycetia bacterium]|nr:hypothetical protein [Planctomycetia bacterium]
MLVENLVFAPFGKNQIRLEWTSESEQTRSWIFINGRFVAGPYRGDALKRSVILTVPTETTFRLEVHDFEDDTVPESIEEEPLVRPLITFNEVSEATFYRIYHKYLDSNALEIPLAEVPARIGPVEVLSPIILEGKNGRWHSFRVEAVDQYNHESNNKIFRISRSIFRTERKRH